MKETYQRFWMFQATNILHTQRCWSWYSRTAWHLRLNIAAKLQPLVATNSWFHKTLFKMCKLNIILFCSQISNLYCWSFITWFSGHIGATDKQRVNCNTCLKTLLWQSARYKLSIYVESCLWLLDECMSDIQEYQLSCHQTTEQLSFFWGPQRTSLPKN